MNQASEVIIVSCSNTHNISGAVSGSIKSGREEGKTFDVVTLERAIATPAAPVPAEGESRYNNRSLGSLA